jgi:methionine synthase II (cobalamin-independent)
MCAQFAPGLPGIVISREKVYVERAPGWDRLLEEFYAAYLDNDIDRFPVTAEYAAGLHVCLARRDLSPLAVKGQVTGPISFGLTATTGDKQPILYDEVLSDAAARLLRLKAAWQERELSQICKNTIIFVDEPAMSSYGSAFFSLPQPRVVALLEEVLGGIDGIKGVHCCGNTDWSLILNTSTDIVSFDTYSYAESLSLYPAEVKQLLDRGGAIAWGIVPNVEDSMCHETVASLRDRLEEAMAPFTRKGIAVQQLVEHSLLTPSCGLVYLSQDGCERALEMLVELSQAMRKKYG